eukprot:CAMPEP_0204054798 /NCGR_PEP_ID=MMETSP0360-20130528/129258_1 /ASSEMBLY_ACC=CAM_ASM_000342 /TAXON_ID=268821 /ORGANISM="Scrippsiella Hangoei, Strain SHTV-5" /LENGTH=62 /DNA_ID=CAMNT_0051002089 /DNA_START=119 /DNA_END=304 /DNA_ORIENTATION=-
MHEDRRSLNVPHAPGGNMVVQWHEDIVLVQLGPSAKFSTIDPALMPLKPRLHCSRDASNQDA